MSNYVMAAVGYTGSGICFAVAVAVAVAVREDLVSVRHSGGES